MRLLISVAVMKDEKVISQMWRVGTSWYDNSYCRKCVPLPFVKILCILTILTYCGKILFSCLFVFILQSSTSRTNTLLILIAPHLLHFFFSSVWGTHTKQPEAQSPAVLEVCALHSSQQQGPGWRALSPLKHLKLFLQPADGVEGCQNRSEPLQLSL